MTTEDFKALVAGDRVRLNYLSPVCGTVHAAASCGGAFAVFVRWDNDEGSEVFGESEATMFTLLSKYQDKFPGQPSPHPILVWPFYDAPQAYRELSPHGGDEDWVAFVPDSFRGDPRFLDQGTSFGCCSVSEHPVDGGTVRIGAHA